LQASEYSPPGKGSPATIPIGVGINRRDTFMDWQPVVIATVAMIKEYSNDDFILIHHESIYEHLLLFVETVAKTTHSPQNRLRSNCP
jgi:hypothetical protein